MKERTQLLIADYLTWGVVAVLAGLLTAAPATPGYLSASAAPPSTGPDWVETAANKGSCPYPNSLCAARFVDPNPTPPADQYVNAAGKVVYGVLFQEVHFQIGYTLCGPPPHTSGYHSGKFYEAFALIGDPGDPTAQTMADGFYFIPFSHEVTQWYYGTGKYVRVTKHNFASVLRAYNSLPNNSLNGNGQNPVTGTNGQVLVLNGPPTPSGQSSGATLDTGTLPNGPFPPSGGPSFNWGDDFGGTAIGAHRFAQQMSICCPAGWVEFTHLP